MATRGILPFVIATALLATSVLPSSASGRRIVLIKKKSAHGDYAAVVAGGNVNNPIHLYVKVTASPQQRVFVSWDDVCVQGSGAGTRSGQFHAQTPITRLLMESYAHPDNCTLSASAQLQGTGNTITVYLEAAVA